MRVISDMLYGTTVENDGVKALVQSLARGRMDKEEAIAIVEYAPRLANCLMEGLGGMFGPVNPPRLIELARDGDLNGGVLSRALSA